MKGRKAMEQLLREWDGETVISRYIKATETWIFIAIHSTRLGPAMGGTRMKPYPHPREALRDAQKLAGGMTYKYAVAGLAHGGGKAVIAVPPEITPQARADVLRQYGRLVFQLGGLFSAGPDVGLSPADMDLIAETGAPYIHCQTTTKGGAGSSGPITALGVFTGIQTACEQQFGDASLTGRRVLVQGVGSVGRALINYLQVAGAEVLFSDLDQTVIRRLRDENKLEFVALEKIFGTECDVFAPCALGGVINGDTIPQLKCRVVAGGANNQLVDPADAERLKAAGILYVPDYVINSGAVLAIPAIEAQGWSTTKAEKYVTDTIRKTLRRVFELGKRKDVSTEAAAREIAEKRLAAAHEG